MSKNDFSGQTAIVTGGTRGIGAAITKAFLGAGVSVTAVYAGNDEAAEKFKNDNPQNLETQKLDVSDYSAVEGFYKNFEDTHDRLDILVNCAGIRRDAVVGMMNPDDWQRVIDVNLTGTFNMSKFAVKAMMKNRYGRIINITSPSGRIGIAGQANYSASKGGMISFTKSLAREVASRKITVNCVSPGFIDTDLIADLTEEQRKSYEAQVPLKRFGKPDEIAPSVLYLAGETGDYITGTVLEVSGGL